jgi:hypothetical protein
MHERFPICKLYIDANFSPSELISLLMEIALAPDQSTLVDIEVSKNAEYHEKLRAKFPDGFLHFRYLADVYSEEAAQEAQAALIALLLPELWAQGIPCVAASLFEHLLPEHGGYRSRAVPFPRSLG